MDTLKAAHLYSVEGIVAVITGGATGIGLMMTKALVANGASKVYVVGRRQEKLDEAARLAPNVIIPLQGDVTSQDSLKSMASRVASETGHINLLICNSGMMGPNTPVQPTDVGVEEFSSKALNEGDMKWYSETHAVNVTSVLWTAYAFLPLLEKGTRSDWLGGGVRSQIIVTSSIAAMHKGPGMSMAYKTSKAAASHLAKNMSATFAPYDVRVNAIAPGLFASDLASATINKAHIDKEKKPWEDGAFDKKNIPLGRIGREEEMGGTILYLCSRAGGYCNGTILLLDGGRLNQLPGY